MAPKQQFEIVQDNEFFPDMTAINLKWIFTKTNEQLTKFLAYHGLLHNNRTCPKSKFHRMVINKRSNRTDGVEWRCNVCKSRNSIRSGSFFERSTLPLDKLLTLLYMWIEDYRNKNAIKETGIGKNAVVNWFNFCRVECHQQRNQIGGEGRIIEIDETCWIKQKHHRGKPKKGTQKWYFGAIEREVGGQAIVKSVKNRKQRTLYRLIQKWIRPGTLIISDEWPAYLQMERKLPMYRHMLIRHKKATGGGFSKMVEMDDGTMLNVNTNKCEGLWAHLKHKTKRIYGTSTSLTDSYMYEALFRQNVRASGKTIMDAFVDVLKAKYCQ